MIFNTLLVIIRKEPFRTLLGYHSGGTLLNLVWFSCGRSPSKPCLAIIRKEPFRPFLLSFGRSPSEPYLVIIRREPFRTLFGLFGYQSDRTLPNLTWISLGRGPFRTLFGYHSDGAPPEPCLVYFRKDPLRMYLILIWKELFRTLFGYHSEGALSNLISS